MSISKEKLYEWFVREVEERPHNDTLDSLANKVARRAAKNKLILWDNIDFVAQSLVSKYSKNKNLKTA